MDKYNVGDKFVIEIEEVYGNGLPFDNKNAPCILYRIKGFNSLVFDDNGLDKLERLDGDYVNENFGELQNEAYEAGKKDGVEEAIKWQKSNEEDFYNQGLNDAWNVLKGICFLPENGGWSADKCKAIFGQDDAHDVLANLTPQEAIAKIEAYEKGQAEIKIGDVVTNGHITMLVTGIGGASGCLFLIGNEGEILTKQKPCNWSKIGKNIDIVSLLKQITE